MVLNGDVRNVIESLCSTMYNYKSNIIRWQQAPVRMLHVKYQYFERILLGVRGDPVRSVGSTGV
jgi:hypothetical protein